MGGLDPTAGGVSTWIEQHRAFKYAWMARWALATGSSPAMRGLGSVVRQYSMSPEPNGAPYVGWPTVSK